MVFFFYSYNLWIGNIFKHAMEKIAIYITKMGKYLKNSVFFLTRKKLLSG